MPPRKPSAPVPKSSKGEKTAEDGPAVFFPLWTEDDISKEYFNAEEAKKCPNKDAKNTKFPFEDPSGKVILPQSLSKDLVKWGRMSEPEPAEPEKAPGDAKDAPSTPAAGTAAAAEPKDPVVFSDQRKIKSVREVVLSEVESTWLRKQHLTYPDRMLEPLVNLVASNGHVMHSEMVRWILGYCADLQRAADDDGCVEFRPWELIWPQHKTEDGYTVPTYNPHGKYIVKLFWLGGWRKVTIDDLVPVDADGKYLLPRSGLDDELWPAIISKAVCKVACLTYEREGGRPEFGDASILQMLTGWQTETSVITPDEPGAVSTAAAICKALSTVCKPREPVEPVGLETEAKDEPAEEAEDKTGTLKKTRDTASARKRKKEAAPSRSSMVVTEKVEDVPADTEDDADGDDDIALLEQQLQGDTAPDAKEFMTKHCAMVDASVSAGSMLPENCGLDSSSSQPVRVLGCHYVGKAKEVDYSDLDSWVVHCSSYDVLYKGKLQYDDPGAWSKTMVVKLGLCLDTEADVQKRALEHKEAGEGHVPLTWHMYLREFCSVFNFLRVHHNVTDLQTIIMESSIEAPSATLRYVPDLRLLQGAKDGGGKGAEVATNFSAGQPFYFHIDSLQPARVLCTLSVAPGTSPRYPGDQPEPPAPEDEVGGSAPPGTQESAAEPAADATDTAPVEQSYERTILPESGAATIENFSWRSTTDPEIAVDMFTTGTITKVVTLPPGRHIFRINTDCKHSYSLLISSDVEMLLGDEEEVLSHLDSSSVRLQSHVALNCQALQIMFLNAEKAHQVVRMVAEKHYQLHGLAEHYLVIFWEALLWALRTTFASDWKSGEDLTPEAIAWTRIVAKLKHDSFREVRAVHREATAGADCQELGSELVSVEVGNQRTADECGTVIQCAFRSMIARKQTQALREVLLSTERPIIAESWEKISSNVVEFGVLFYRRQFELDRSLLNAFDFGADERDRAKLCDLRGTTDPKPANQWIVLFKEVFNFKELTEALAQLRVVLPPPAEGEVQVATETFQLSIINNDTCEVIPEMFGRALSHTFAPNVHGYTFLASGCSPVPVPALEWSLRVLSYPDFPYDEEVPIKNGSLEPVEEIGPARPMLTPGSAADVLNPLTGEITLKYDIFFRYQIKIASEQEICSFSFSVDPTEIPDGVLHLELFEDGKQIACETVKHCVVLPFVRLKGVARPELDEPEDDGKGKGKDKGKEKRGKSAPKKRSDSVAKSKDSAPAVGEGGDANTVPEDTGPTYTVVGRILSGAPPATIEPKAGSAPPAAKKKDKKKPKSAGGAKDDYPAWKFNIFSEAPDRVTCTPDRVREEEINSKKMGWEAVEAGRAEKAKALRTTFLASDAVEPPAADGPAAAAAATVKLTRPIHLPELVKKTSEEIVIFDDAYINHQDKARFQVQSAYRKERDALVAQRSDYRSKRRDMNSSHIERYSSLRSLRNGSLTTKQDLRGAYRQRILDEAFAKKSAEEARAAALEAEKLALEIALNGSARPPSRKDKKK